MVKFDLAFCCQQVLKATSTKRGSLSLSLSNKMPVFVSLFVSSFSSDLIFFVFAYLLKNIYDLTLVVLSEKKKNPTAK